MEHIQDYERVTHVHNLNKGKIKFSVEEEDILQKLDREISNGRA
jgi:hypothetical protein|tara:strand:- start:323 stop:454 length:132 start_codon:yes stop_codon:yes gene_type:complete